MNKKNTGLEAVTNPQSGLLFILGVVLFACLGSAIYDWAVLVLGGASPTVFSRIALISLVLVLGIVFWIQYRLKQHSRPATSYIAPSFAQSSPQPFLIFCVSNRSKDPLEPKILQHHSQNRTLKACVFLFTEESTSQLNSLEQSCAENNIHVLDSLKFDNITDPEHIYRTVQQAITIMQNYQSAKNNNEAMVFNITPGTALMTALATQACLQQGIAMEYAYAPVDSKTQTSRETLQFIRL